MAWAVLNAEREMRNAEQNGPFTFAVAILAGACAGQPKRSFLQTALIFSQAARQHAAESPKLSLLRAARRQPAIFIWGRDRQAMHLPYKQAYVGASPTASTNFHCGKLA